MQWIWTWANFRRRRGTERPGTLQSMGSQRVEQDWVTEQQNILLLHSTCCCFILHIVTELWGNNSAIRSSTCGIKQALLTVRAGVPGYNSGKWSSMEKWRVIILGHLVSVSIGNQSSMPMNRSMQSTQVSTGWIGKEEKNTLTHLFFLLITG